MRSEPNLNVSKVLFADIPLHLGPMHRYARERERDMMSSLTATTIRKPASKRPFSAWTCGYLHVSTRLHSEVATKSCLVNVLITGFATYVTNDIYTYNKTIRPIKFFNRLYSR